MIQLAGLHVLRSAVVQIGRREVAMLLRALGLVYPLPDSPKLSFQPCLPAGLFLLCDLARLYYIRPPSAFAPGGRVPLSFSLSAEARRWHVLTLAVILSAFSAKIEVAQ